MKISLLFRITLFDNILRFCCIFGTVAPVCRPGQRTIYSTGRQEIVKVACEVEANPSDVSFVWKFNTSLVETVDIPANLIGVDRTRSVAHFTPHTENVSIFY